MDPRDAFPLDEDLLDGGLSAGFSPPTELAKPLKEGAGARSSGIWFGDYRVIRELGRGGMGVVYEAEQVSLGRRVALKVLPFHALRSSAFVERFRREAQAAAALHHSNIVTVYGVGEHNGIPYYAMRFIEGRSLEKVIEDGIAAPAPDSASRESCRRAARIGIQAADALAYAHERGVLHRDIKPSNLLLDEQGVVWIADFGLAKAEDAESLTHSGDFVGTIKYMAPERFDGLSLQQGDVYSLGLTLYEILTLRPVFGSTNREGLIDKVLHERPPDPRKVNPAVPRDLETIVLKATAKSPVERYPGARALADDLRRFLEDRPIEARRASATERAWRWCRRNPVVATLGTGVMLLLAGITLVFAIMAVRLEKQRDLVVGEQAKTAQSLVRAETAESERKEELYKSYLAQARFGRLTGRGGQSFAGLDAIRKAIGLVGRDKLSDAQLFELRNEAIACLVTPDFYLEREVQPGLSREEKGGLAFDHKVERYTQADDQGRIILRDWKSGRVLATFPPTHPIDFWFVGAAFSSDDRLLLMSYHANSGPPWTVVWDLESNETILDVFHAGSVDLAGDGSIVAAPQEDGTVAIFGLKERKEIARRGKGLLQEPRVRLDRRAKRLACTVGQTVSLFDLDSDREDAFAVFDGGVGVMTLAWSPDSSWIAVGSSDSKLRVYDVERRCLRATLVGHENVVVGVEFDRTGRLLASAGWDNTTRLWDPFAGREWVRITGNCTVFSSDGKSMGLWNDMSLGVCAVAWGGPCLLLHPRVPSETSKPRPVLSPDRVAWSADGRAIASTHDDGFRIWDATTGEEAAHVPIENVSSVLFEPGRGSLLSYGELGLWRWPWSTGAEGSRRRQLGPPVLVAMTEGAGRGAVRMDAAGKLLAYTEGSDGSAVVVDLEEPSKKVSLLESEKLIGLALSPDGHWAAGMQWKDAAVRVWRVETGEVAARLSVRVRGRIAFPLSAAFSPDGEWLVAGSTVSVRFWRVGSWDLRREFPKRTAEIAPTPIAFDTACGLAALAIDPRTITLIRLATGEELAVLTPRDGRVIQWLSFSPDSSRLAAVMRNRTIQLWDLASLRSELASLGLEWGLPEFSRPAGADRDPLRVEVHGADVPRSVWRERGVEALRSLLEDQIGHWIGRSDATRADFRGEVDGVIEAYELGGLIDGSELPALSAEARNAWNVVRAAVEGVRGQAASSSAAPHQPRNVAPPPGAIAGAEPVVLEWSPFSAEDASLKQGWSRVQVRAAGGDYASSAVHDAFFRGSGARCVLPRGLLVSRGAYFWRAMIVGWNGKASEWSEETSFTAGDLGVEAVSFDLSNVFNRDVVANPGDDEDDEFDPGGNDKPLLTVQGYDTLRADNPIVRGLPLDRRVGVHVLGDYSGPNALQLASADRGQVRIEAPRGHYAAVRFLVSSGWGDATVPVVFVYASGAREEKPLHADDWYDKVPPTRQDLVHAGSVPVWSGMDHIRRGHLVDNNEGALFEVILPAREEEELKAIILDPARGRFDRDVTRLNLFAVTGMRVQ